MPFYSISLSGEESKKPESSAQLPYSNRGPYLNEGPYPNEGPCQPGETIGSGAFGMIKINTADGQVIKIQKSIESVAELDILFRLQSNHLLKGTNIFAFGECGNEEFVIETERMDSDLDHFIYPSYAVTKDLMYQIALGLKCLHDNNYLHLDLKPANVLYKRKGYHITAKIADFGHSLGVQRDETLLPAYTNALLGTLTYLAPESLSGSKMYTNKNDIWSLGVTFLEMLTGNYVFKSQTENELLVEITNWDIDQFVSST